MMVYLIITIIGMLIFLVLPMPLQIVVVMINSATPDPIPYIDEIIMYGTVLKKCANTSLIFEWIGRHKIITVFIMIMLILVCILIF